MPCDALDWTSYKGTVLKRFPGTATFFYMTDRMEIDADGAPNAYHPDDTGLDELANAEFPNGNWRSILVADPVNPAMPAIQAAGPFAGFYISMTTLQDKTREMTDPARYVDATQIPYIVFPGRFYAMKGTGSMGDFAMVRNLTDGKTSAALVADVGPSEAALGEVSIRLAENLGGSKVNPRNGAGKPKGPFLYVLFPRSRVDPPWPVGSQTIEETASAKLSALGGWDRVLPCANADLA